MKFLNVCRRHLDIFLAEPRWNPSNPALKLTNLEAKLDAGYGFAENVRAEHAPFEIVVNNRQAVYQRVDPAVRASRRYLKSSGASEREIADANTIINKILGKRAKAKMPDPNKPAAEIEKTNSVSHQSYDSILGNVSGLKDFYGNIPT